MQQVAKAATSSSVSTSVAKSAPLIYMIAGHIDISFSEFLEQYSELLERAIHNSLPSSFIPFVPSSTKSEQQLQLQQQKQQLPLFDMNKVASFLPELKQLNPQPQLPHTLDPIYDLIPDIKQNDVNSLAQDCSFVVGDAAGADFFSQLYLCARGLTSRVTVYHQGQFPRFLASKRLKTMGGFNSHTAKDAAMTRASEVDIAYIRTEEEQRMIYGEKYRNRTSGTEKNILRRKQYSSSTSASSNGGDNASANSGNNNNNNNNGRYKKRRLQ